MFHVEHRSRAGGPLSAIRGFAAPGHPDLRGTQPSWPRRGIRPSVASPLPEGTGAPRWWSRPLRLFAGRGGPLCAHKTCFCRSVRSAAGLLVLAAVLLLPGCAGVRSVRLYFPEASGLEMVRPGVYVDPAMTAPRREAFAADLEAGRQRAAEFYGGLISSPKVVACASMACYRRFGGIGRKGVSRNGALLLSPEGLTPVIVAHEWSHAELAARIGQLRTWWSVPQWFDDGIAVHLSGDPEYTEEAWRGATDNGTKAPPLSELETLRGWLRVTGKDGKTKQLSYGTARHEVAGWYAAAGPDGFRALIEGLKNGDDFRKLYERTGKTDARTDVPRGTSPPAAGAVKPATGDSGRGAGPVPQAGEPVVQERGR